MVSPLSPLMQQLVAAAENGLKDSGSLSYDIKVSPTPRVRIGEVDVAPEALATLSQEFRSAERNAPVTLAEKVVAMASSRLRCLMNGGTNQTGEILAMRL